MEVSFRRGPRREGEDTVTLDLDVLPRVDDTILWDGESYDVRDVKWWLNDPDSDEPEINPTIEVILRPYRRPRQ
jgi:hypothetical protein